MSYHYVNVLNTACIPFLFQLLILRLHCVYFGELQRKILKMYQCSGARSVWHPFKEGLKSRKFG